MDRKLKGRSAKTTKIYIFIYPPPEVSRGSLTLERSLVLFVETTICCLHLETSVFS